MDRPWSGPLRTATAASVVMGAINTACAANPNLTMCQNETALKAANIAVSSLAILAQAQCVASLIISAAKGTLEAASKAAIGAQAVGMVIGIAVTWVSFAFAVIGSHGDPIVWRVALGIAIVTTIWLIVLFALNFIPIVGQIISAILSLIDMIISLFTGLFTDEAWSVAKVVLNLFYDAKALTSLDAAEFGEFASSLRDEALGMVGGNTFWLSVDAGGTMVKTKDGNDDDLLQSWVEGKLLPQTATGAFTHQDASTARECAIIEGKLNCSNTAALGYALVPRINGVISFLAEINYAYRWAEYALYGAVRWKTHSDEGTLPDPNADDYEEPVPSTLYLDIPPADLDSLWNWAELVNPDLDGDGLSTAQEASLGTNPNLWDTDGDGLSDGYEWSNRAHLGCDPTKRDTDGDGLSDGQELRLGTRCDMADTDGDGLSDGDEVRRLDASLNWVGGWQVALPGSRAAWVSSDPLQADADRDGLTDAEEMRNGLSPYAPNQPVPTLSLRTEPLSGIPGGRAGMYLLPGDVVTVTLELVNWATSPVTTTLGLSLPSFFTDVQVGAMQGTLTPPVQSSGERHTWSFAAPYTLHLFESVAVTITARVATSVSTGSGEIAVDLPYAELSLGKTVSVVMDGDNPTVTLEAPADGALLRGTSYVVGGSAWDPTTWITGVELSIVPGGASPSYQSVSDTSPWAYTWSLPSDGVYTLRARASDPMGHSSTSPAVSVTVDNTPPNATITVDSFATGTTNTIQLSGTATDNLSGVERAQISINGQPWRSVQLTGAGTTSATWLYDWTVGDSAQGRHEVAVRAFDRVGNSSAITTRQIVVDRVPPSSALTGGADPDVAPAVGVSTPLTLTGVADEGGYLPLPALPVALRQGMGIYADTTVWLGLSSVSDNDSGVQAAWLGDLNGDRLADLAVGLPAADDGRGRVTVLYGRAGGWPTPPDLEMLEASRTHFVGEAGKALGTILAAAGDVNGDGFADLLVGETASTRAFLVFGNPGPLGNVTLDAPQPGYRVVLQAPAAITDLASAGDADGDGFADLLLTAGGSSYLVQGQKGPWPQTLQVDAEAVAVLSGVTGATGVGDVNGDQRADWVTTVSGQVRLFQGSDTLASPSAAATFSTADTAPRVAATGDVDADGYDDILYSDGTSGVLVYGNASMSSWVTRTFSGYGGLLAAAGDVDGDGRADFMLSDTAGVASLIRRTPAGSFETLAT
ncbi:MAG: FG-GAP-like repeat-containing protein, partial [Anaerolineae bacterium]